MKAELVIVAGANRGLIVPLGESSFTAGRDSSCDLQIFDEGVSRRHFQIGHEEKALVLVDLGSRNGTRVNGADVTRARVYHRDRIACGESEFLLLAPEFQNPEHSRIELGVDEPGAPDEWVEDSWHTTDLTRAIQAPPAAGTPPPAEADLAAVERLGVEIARAASLEDASQILLDAVDALVPHRRIVVFRYQEENDHLVPLFHRRAPGDPRGEAIRVERRLVERCCHAGVSICQRRSGRTTVLVAPLAGQERVIGAVYLEIDPGVEPKGRLRLLATLSRQSGMALERAELLAELRYRNLKLDESNTRLEDAGRKLDQASRKIESLVEGIPAGALLVDEEGRIVVENRRARALLESVAALALGEPPVIASIGGVGWHEWAARARGGREAPCESTLVARDGSRRLSVSIALVSDSGSDSELAPGLFALLVSDVTRLGWLEIRHRILLSLVESTTDFVGIADGNGRAIYVNPAGQRMLGISANEDATGFEIARYHPESTMRRFETEIIPAALRDGVWTGEVAFRSRDLREIPVSMVLAAHCDHAGRLEYIATISRDLTERRIAEERERDLVLARAAAQAARLSGLGQLAAGVSHEFNQPLSVILGHVQRVLAAPGQSPEDLARELRPVLEAGQRMARIVENVRLFSRREALGRETKIAAEKPVEDALMLVSEDLALAGIPLVRAYASDLPAVAGDSARLQQVFMILLANARDAVAELPGGVPRRITVRIDPDGQSVVYAVEDSGAGVPEAAVGRLFTPFFTTKEPGEGTGLGLSVSYGIVKEHGGEISYAKIPAGGARFTVRIPRAAGSASALASGLEPRARAAGPIRARILVVDDEPMVRTMLARCLEDWGHEAVLAASAEDALATLERSRFELVLSDMRMPGRSGEDLVRAIRARDPSLPIALMTGYISPDRESEPLPAGVGLLLRKPFGDLERVRREVEGLLGGGGRPG